jgi:hypothetical protein
MIANPKIIRQEAENGNRSALSAYILLRRMLEDLTADAEAVKELAIREHQERHSSEEVTIDGAVVKKHPGRAMYDYKGIQQWVLQNQKLKAIEDKAKYAAQVAVSKGGQVVDEDTGEIIEPAKVTYTKDSISVSFQ